MREIVLDTETTGLDPASGHRIVEIGCVELVNRSRTGNHFHVYLNPQREMPQEAYRIHGLSDDFLRDKPVFQEIAEQFLAFIGEDTLVIHNAAFDMRFLNYELEALGHNALSQERVIDTLLISRTRFPGQPANLDALCKRLGVDNSDRKLHGALLDADLLSQVYMALSGGAQSSFNLDHETSSGGQEKAASAEIVALADAIKTDAAHTAARSFPPTEEELAAHEQLLGKLKAPLWKAE